MKCMFCDKEQTEYTCFTIGNKQICDVCLNELTNALHSIKVINELNK